MNERTNERTKKFEWRSFIFEKKGEEKLGNWKISQVYFREKRKNFERLRRLYRKREEECESLRNKRV